MYKRLRWCADDIITFCNRQQHHDIQTHFSEIMYTDMALLELSYRTGLTQLQFQIRIQHYHWLAISLCV